MPITGRGISSSGSAGYQRLRPGRASFIPDPGSQGLGVAQTANPDFTINTFDDPPIGDELDHRRALRTNAEALTEPDFDRSQLGAIGGVEGTGGERGEQSFR